MKKVLALVLSINFCMANCAYAIQDEIADELVKNLQPLNEQIQTNVPPIQDTLINDEVAQTAKPFKQIQNDDISDTFAENYLKNIKPVHVKQVQNIEIADTFAEKSLKNTNINPTQKILITNFDNINEKVIKIKSLEYLTTKDQSLKEGQPISFKMVEPIKLNNTQLSKDTVIVGKIETISMNQAFGVPADIIIGNFYVKNNKNIQLVGEIHQTGANRSLWVYPIGYLGMVFFFAGLLVLPIRGGHAKINTDKIYQVYAQNN